MFGLPGVLTAVRHLGRALFITLIVVIVVREVYHASDDPAIRFASCCARGGVDAELPVPQSVHSLSFVVGVRCRGAHPVVLVPLIELVWCFYFAMRDGRGVRYRVAMWFAIIDLEPSAAVRITVVSSSIVVPSYHSSSSS